MTLPPGTAIHATTADRYDASSPPTPSPSSSHSSANSTRAARNSSPRASPASMRLDAGERPDFLARDRQIRETPMDRRAAPRRPARPPRRDHRPRRPQDDHQRAQLRREGLHGRLRRLHHTHLGEPPRRPAQPPRRHPPHHHLRRPHHQQALRAHRQPRRPLRSRPRLAPRRASPRRRRRIHVRFPLRLRPLPLPQREGTPSPRLRPLLLSAQDRVAPRSPSLERHLRPRQDLPRHPARHHQRHRPHRNHPRHLRDGRDPLRTPRPLRRPQLRPLGLHLLLHQEARRRHLRPPPRPRRRSP